MTLFVCYSACSHLLICLAIFLRCCCWFRVIFSCLRLGAARRVWSSGLAMSSLYCFAVVEMV